MAGVAGASFAGTIPSPVAREASASTCLPIVLWPQPDIPVGQGILPDANRLSPKRTPQSHLPSCAFSVNIENSRAPMDFCNDYPDIQT